MSASAKGTPLRKSAGQLKQRVTLQQAVSVTDALGGRAETWQAFGQDWAAIDPMPFVVSEVQATVLFQVSMRYRADVVEKDLAGTQLRIVEQKNDRVLKVLAVINPEERQRDLVLTCGKAVVGN